MRLRAGWLFLILLMLIPPHAGWTAALTSSFKRLDYGVRFIRWQPLLCDISGQWTGTGPTGGESCSSGDYAAGNANEVMDCAGAQIATLAVSEVGTGSIDVDLYTCKDVPGVFTGGVDPATTAFCRNLTSSVAVDGVTVLAAPISQDVFHRMVAKVVTCTGNCDAHVEVTCRW